MNTMIDQSQQLTTHLDDAYLASVGLGREDQADIQDLALKMGTLTPASIHTFGKDTSRDSSHVTEQLLEQVRNDDLADNGQRLTKVVSIARELNVTKLSARSRFPVVGPLIDRFRLSKSDLVQKFSSTRQQIEQLLTDVETQASDLVKRTDDLEVMHTAVGEERRRLGLHAAAGKVRLAELDAERRLLEGREDANSQLRLAEVNTMQRLLEKRVADLAVLQHAATQALPTIRIIQANNISLVEKFHAIRDITIPAWKQGFALRLALNEQRNAVELANAVDDATNDMMRSNIKLLRENAVSTAKANQRLAIDLPTLEFVHHQLIETIDDLRKAHEEGQKDRASATAALQVLQQDVQKRLAAPVNVH